MSSVQKVVLIPRYSSLTGPHTYRFAPVNVRDFAKADLTAWRGVLAGTDALFSVFLEESIDLVLWNEVLDSSMAPSAGTEAVASCELELPWVRAVVDLSAPITDCAVTCWMVGNFTLRDR